VTPGEVSIEKGSSLVVLARFGTPPKEAELVITETSGTARRLPLTRSLADPVFGGSVPDVSSNFLYHVEYGGERTKDFAVKVFEIRDWSAPMSISPIPPTRGCRCGTLRTPAASARLRAPIWTWHCSWWSSVMGGG
jgi:hypothetical protein